MTKQFVAFATQIAVITAAVVAVLHVLGVDPFYLKLTAAIGVGIVAVGALVLALSNLRLGRGAVPPDEAAHAARAARRARTAHLLRRLRMFFSDLRRAQAGHRLWYREEAPWWLVLGPDGHGKSALLRAAPDAREHAALAPEDPTAEPRFFSAAGLGLVELPGDFDRHPGFARFLRLIARKRPRQPFAGVLVVARFDDEPPAESLARTRALLLRLCGELAVRPPVVLVATHLDRLAGFVEFCDGLPTLTRPFGVTLPACDSPAAVTQALHARLQEPLAWVRQRCHALVACPRAKHQQSNLYSFWQHFEELTRRTVAAAGVLAAQPLAGGESLRPRAAYFLSSTPTDAADDRWLGNLARRLGGAFAAAPPPDHSPTQAFVRGLFTTELLRDAPLATRLRLFRWRRAGLQALAAAALAGTAVVASRSISAAAETELAHMQATWDAAREALLRPRPNRPIASAALASLQHEAEHWSDDPPFAAAWGLHRGDLVREPADRIYALAVCHGVLKPLAEQSKEALAKFNRQHASGPPPSTREQARLRILEHLHAYTLLSGAEPDSTRPDAWRGDEFAWLSAELRARWAEDDPAGIDDVRADILKAHADRVSSAPAIVPEDADPCLASGGAVALRFDPELADETSEIIARVPREAGVMEEILRKLEADRSLRAVELERPMVTAANPVARVYTAHGWERVSREIAREVHERHHDQWYVRGRHAVNNRREYCVKLRDNYVARYISHWSEAIRGLKIRRTGELEQLKVVFRSLTEDKPLHEVFLEIDRNTQHLPSIPCPELGADDNPLVQAFNRALARLGLGGSQPLAASSAAVGNRDAADVIRKFAGFVDYGAPGARGKDGALQLDVYQQHLAKLFKMLPDAGPDKPDEMKTLYNVAFAAKQDITSDIGNSDHGGWDQDLNDLVIPPLEDLMFLADELPARALNAKWCQAVVAPMRELLLGRYPFESGAHRDAAFDDITRLFHPTTGEIAKFRAAHLGNLVDTSGASVTERPLGSNASRHLGDRTLAFLDDAHKLGLLLFPGETPGLDLMFRSTCQANVSKLVLKVDAEEHPYRCGPDPERSLHWPVAKGEGDAAGKPGVKNGAQLVARGRNGLPDEVFQPGAFGLLRLLEEDGHPRRLPGSHAFTAEFTFDLFGKVKLTFTPTTTQGGSLMFGFHNSAEFLAPLRTHALRSPPEQLYREFPFSCQQPTTP